MIEEDFNLDTLENTFAAWLDGALTPEEEGAFMDYCSHDNEIQEILDANDQVEETYEEMVDNGYELPFEMYGDFELPSINDGDYDSYTSCEYDNDDYEEDCTDDSVERPGTTGNNDFIDCGFI